MGNFITISDEQIYYNDVGAGPVLVLIHGNFSSSVFFTELIDRLKGTYRIIAPDLRGFGESSCHHPITHMADFAADLKAMLNYLQVQPVAVLGWSLGGVVAMELSVQMGIESTILLSAPFVGSIDDMGLYEGTYRLFQFTQAVGGLYFNPFGVMDFKRMAVDNTLATLVYGKRPEAAIYQRNLESALQVRGMDSILDALRTYRYSGRRDGRVLILHGDEDHVIHITEAQKNHHFFTNSKLVVFHHGAHALMIDDEDGIYKMLIEFLKKADM
ncbi:alpha/beta hydrolase [Peptoniphilus equinus]|uniref:Alpha/beta hydrolase n=1 Tax=Peptoniphilus equinus TaxID=3016343 RepID=A0ABY7QV52_9FIRM|nr:alpha/beta hydrolase [Peptoniphilus equinus]WBW49964.1 alpha/beta hydrolase [Peptoniphilus equinus]